METDQKSNQTLAQNISQNNNAFIYAGFWIRFLASFVDAIIILIPSIILSGPFQIVGSLIWGLLYYPVFESSFAMATPGKVVCGLKLLTEDGKKLSLKTALIRYFFRYVSCLFLCLGFFLNLFTKKRQTLHDMVSGTIVVLKDTTEEINWFKLWLNRIREILSADQTLAFSTNGSSTVDKSDLGQTNNTTDKNQNLAIIQQLDELFKLYQKGALTEAEYQTQKAKILSQP